MTTAICEWNNVPFAQGRFRYAYKGKWTSNYPIKPGQYCVVKKFKDSYTKDISRWEITVNMQIKAQEMAKKFGCKIEYTDCDVIRCIRSNDATASVRMNEYVAAEDYLEGDFIKCVTIMDTYQKKQEELITSYQPSCTGVGITIEDDW